MRADAVLPMRILLTADPELPVPPPLYGGIERMIALLADGLRARGHVVGVVAHDASTVEAEARFGWPGTRSRDPSDSVRNALVLRQAVRAFRPDLLHSFSRILYMAPVLRSSLPKIMAYQRPPTPRAVRLASRIAASRLTFSGVSDYICQEGRRHGGRWVRIHNGVDPGRYDFRPHVEADAPLVFLARVESVKGAHLAIEIAQQSGRRLVIAGPHADSGPEAEYWKHRILPRLGEGVEYVGPVDDMEKNHLLGRAAALLLPIQWDEPFGIAFVEALACGTPVIGCPRGALPEIVRDGLEGYLVDDVAAGCRAADGLAGISRAACRARAVEHFSADAMVDRTVSLYDELLGRSFAARPQKAMPAGAGS